MHHSVSARGAPRHVNGDSRVTTSALFIREGATVRLPSDQLAVLIKWRIRAIDRENLAAGVERVAIVRTRAGVQIECSEPYMSRAVVL